MQRFDGFADGKNGRNSLEALALLLGNSDHKPHYRGAHISLRTVNVLPQPRKTFEAIPELALDIAEKGQLNPLIVARFDRKRCERHLALVNRLWNTSFGIHDMHAVREKKRNVFYVLLAGERRYRSLYLLWEIGCAACREKYGREAKGKCFHRHFHVRNDNVETRLCIDIQPLAALYLQLSENTHIQVPPYEEAHAYALLFRLVRQADGEFSIAQFARKVGRSPETVRNAIHFSELPVSVQDYVAKGFMPYGIGVELTRLHRSGIKKSQLDWWALRAATEHKKVPEFRELVTKYLANQNSNQMDLLGIMTAEEEKLQRRLHIRRTVEANVIQALWSWIHYFQKVRALFKEGKLGLPDSPFSARSSRRVFLTLADELEKVLPHFKKLLPLRRYAEASNILDQAKEIVQRLDAEVPIVPMP